MDCTPDFAIVGGGIFGCSIAWNLVGRGAGRVLLLERRDLAAATTSRAAALLARVCTAAGQTALTNETREAIVALAGELDEPLDVREVGSLHVAAAEASATSLVAFAELVEAAGEEVNWIDHAEAEERIPWLDASAAQRIAVMPGDAFIDPYTLAIGYARAARARGAELVVGCEVLGLRRERDRVVGLRTTHGDVAAGCVIDAAGPWAGLLAFEAGWHLPMAPVRSHYWITAPAPEFEGEQPYVVLPDAGAYARTEVGGLLFGLRDRQSLTRDPRELPVDLTNLVYHEDPDGWEVLAERGPGLTHFFPGLGDAQIAHYVAAASTYTPDNQFVLGALPGVAGFLVATGCCGAGISTSGGVGAAIAELAIEGRSSFDLEPFRTDRFGVVDAFDPAWLRRCALARARKTSG